MIASYKSGYVPQSTPERATLTGTYTASATGPHTLEFYNWRNGSYSNDIKNYIDDIVLAPAATDLMIETDNISVATGGSANMTLLAGPSNAGKPYLVLGSLGTHPGITVDGVKVHLNMDPLFNFTRSHMNSAVMQQSFGTLDGSGQGACTFDTVASVNPAYLGMSFNFAYVLLTAPASRPVTYASLPVKVNFIP